MSGLTFLSWARAGAQLDAAQEDPLAGPLPSHGALTVGVQLNQLPEEVVLPARLYGPGDVTGLDSRQVIRVDPAPGADAAEPTFFPLVEFGRPDLPWLLTPAKAKGGERLRPWLVLVVAEAATARVGQEPDAVLPVLRCPLRDLPNLDDSWAWAHAQLATDGVLDESTLNGLLTGPPEGSLSRLLCPRRLSAGIGYVACVVPAFEAGRKRGLGLALADAEEAELQPAWAAADSDEEIALPVYHHWVFSTGPEGDFKALVRRLRPRPMPNTLGLRPMDVSHPATGLPVIDPADPAAVLGLEGALRGPVTAPSTWDPDAAEAFAAALTPLLARAAGTDREFLNNPNFDDSSGTGPTRLEGAFRGGPSAAADWRVWNNADVLTTTEQLPTTRPAGSGAMVHVSTGGDRCGLFQRFLDANTGPTRVRSSAWVFVLRGTVQLGTGNGDNTEGDTVSSGTGRWELLSAPNGLSPANELIIYSRSSDGAEFYVDEAAVRLDPPPRPPGRLGPPLYGMGPAGVVDLTGAPRWLRELNLDPRHRAAAAFGAQVIRQHQEALMASAWAQVAVVARANEALRQGQLARTAAERAYLRRLVGATGFHAQRLLQVSAPVHDVLAAARELDGNREVQAALSPAFRRVTRPRGPLARRLAPEAPLPPPVDDLGQRTLKVNPPLTPAPGMVALEDLTGDKRGVKDLSADRLTLRWDPGVEPEPPVPDTPRVLHVGASMPNRVFLVTEDGRVFSRVDSPPAWHNHGFPPGGRAASQPVALRDLHAFVSTADGRLCSLNWDGDRWAWQDHGKPKGFAVAGRPLALARDSQDGDRSVTGKFWSVYVCAADGHVWELSLDTGFWSDLGAPPGTTALGAPGGREWDLFIHGGNGHLWQLYHYNVWAWLDLGMPGAGVDTSTPAPGIPLVRMTSGQVYIRIFILGGLWINFTPMPVTHILGFDNGLWVADEGSGRLWRYYTPAGSDTSTWESHDVVGLRGWGALRGGEPWVAADGKLMVRRMTPSDYRWDDFGLPASGGAGAPGAPPLPRPAWRGTLGFMSNLLVAHVRGPNAAYLRVGRDLGFDGEVRGGWELKPAGVPGMGAGKQGVGLALADLNGSGGQDLVLFWVDAVPGLGNFGSWRVGRDSGPGGDITWVSRVRRMPTPMSTRFSSSGGGLTNAYSVQACAIALGDLDGNKGGRPELIVAYVSGIGGRVYYRIGWGLDAVGDVTGGWTESIEVPWPGRTAGVPVKGLGVAVADIDNDLRPELVVLLVEHTAAGLEAKYMIGWQINGRGQVVGGWTGPHPVGGEPIGADAQGATITLADFSGSHSPDLVFFHIEHSPTGNRAYYRVGFDLQPRRPALPGSGLPWDPSSGLPLDNRWSEPREVDARWGSGSRGAGIAVGDLDNSLLARKREFAERFRAAAVSHQQRIQRAQQLARADDEAKLSAAAVIAGEVTAALKPDPPDGPVTARVTDRISGVNFSQLPPDADRLNPLAVAPSFPQPMSVPLAELSQDLLLPGVETVPPDTLTLVRANSTFIEAYMAGLNHEFAGELLWREFPGDKRGTFFRQFWEARGGDPARGPLTDIPPIAEWRNELGAHATAVGGPDMVVLLVRGELLRRYPHAQVYARRASGPARAPRVLGTETLPPQFQGSLPPDLMFFGFPLTLTQARGTDTDPGWFIVLAEHPTGPRFGLDEPPKEPTYGTAPATWEDLDWARLAPNAAALTTLRHAPRQAPFLQPPLDTVTRPARSERPGEPPPPELTWPRNSAHLAHITLQRTVEVAIHATDMLPDLGEGWRITGVATHEDDPPQTRIHAVGGIHPDGTRWRFTVGEVAEAIRRREQFSVQEPTGDRVRVVVSHTSDGRPYLRTEGDGEEPDTLLSLPRLPNE